MTDKPTPPLSGEEAMREALVKLRYRLQQEPINADTIDEHCALIDAALSAPPQDGDRSAKSSSSPAVAAPRPSTADPFPAAAAFLFGLLDDIDTASDMAKGDDRSYRAMVERLQRRRFEVASTDGYSVTFHLQTGDKP